MYMQELTVYLMGVGLIIACHPLCFLIKNEKYRFRQGRIDCLYLQGDLLSAIAGNRFIILVSIVGALGGLVVGNAALVIPLVACSWILFIRDRFRSLGRGLGAPGYFSFFQFLLVFWYTLFKSKTTSSSLEGYCLIIGLSTMIAEFACIFISAGSFKLGDLKINNRPLSFALGLKSPMWSRIWRYNGLIHRCSRVLNVTGPVAQLAGGLLIAIPTGTTQAIGCLIVGSMFLLIAPVGRLGWLCLSISSCAGGIYVASLAAEELMPDLQYARIIYTLIIIARLGGTLLIFEEYFLGTNIMRYWQRCFGWYRQAMGCIAWRVFTFEIVRYVIPTKRQATTSTEGQIAIEIEKILEEAANTTVYDAITAASLMNSKEYLPDNQFNSRLLHYMDCHGLDRISYLLLNRVTSKTLGQEVDPFRKLSEVVRIGRPPRDKFAMSNASFSEESFKRYR